MAIALAFIFIFAFFSAARTSGACTFGVSSCVHVAFSEARVFVLPSSGARGRLIRDDALSTNARAPERSPFPSSGSFTRAIELPSDDECRGALSTPEVPTFSPHWIKRGVALFLSLDA